MSLMSTQVVLDRSITRMVSNCVMMKVLHSSTGELKNEEISLVHRWETDQPTIGTHGPMFISTTCLHACMIMDSEHSAHSSVHSNGQDQIARILAVSSLLLSSSPMWEVVNNVSLTGFSWLFRPFANWFLQSAKKNLTNPTTVGLIFCSRAALTMWEGVQETKWSFLSPPWQLRDKGNLKINP